MVTLLHNVYIPKMVPLKWALSSLHIHHSGQGVMGVTRNIKKPCTFVLMTHPSTETLESLNFHIYVLRYCVTHHDTAAKLTQHHYPIPLSGPSPIPYQIVYWGYAQSLLVSVVPCGVPFLPPQHSSNSPLTPNIPNSPTPPFKWHHLW